jgi:hypothetical protein
MNPRVTPGADGAGDPALARLWRKAEFPDDKESAGNVRGAFAFAMTGPGARTTQIYICTDDSMKRRMATASRHLAGLSKAWMWWTGSIRAPAIHPAAACAPAIRAGFLKKATRTSIASFRSLTG